MKLSTTIEFKTVPEIYEKECSGIKNNTVRFVTEDEDRKIRSMLKDIKYIRIVNTDDRICTSSFVRTLKDITRNILNINRCANVRFEIVYIFTWES